MHHREDMALGVEPLTSGPTRHLVIVQSRQIIEIDPVELAAATKKTTARAGMFTPSAKVSVVKSSFTWPLVKSRSTMSLNVGRSPAW
jgi:hypothetical protein